VAFRILYNAASDQSGVTITSSTDTDALPDSNVVDNRPGITWRTTDVGLEWVKWDYGVGNTAAVNCVGCFGFNYDAGDTIVFQGNATDSWGSPTVNETITLGTDSDGVILQRVVHFFASQSLRFWRWTIDDASSGKDYFDTGRLMFGTYYETTRDASSDLRVEILDPSGGQRSLGEAPIVTEKPRYRRIRTSFSFVGTTERDKWETILTRIGNSRPAMISWDPADRPVKDSAYVYLVTPLDLAHRFVGYYDIASLVWEEKTR